jgi:hypothetical protein
MNVPPWAGFVADFPDDQVEAGGDIRVYGGRNVALALGEVFAGLGCSRIAEPWSVDEMGWEFGFEYGDHHSFECRVQSFHPVFWLLLDGPSTSHKGAAAYVELWRKFGNALERDSRFRNILWRSFKDGPPDWEEVEAADDPPSQTFDERFPLSEIVGEKSGFGCSLAIILIWIWFTLSGIAVLAIGLTSKIHKERAEDIPVGIVMIILCLTPPASMIIETIRRRLKRGS